MKIIVGRDYCSHIYVDTNNELGLGPFEFAMVGDYDVAAYIDGRFSLLQKPRDFKGKPKPRRTP
jgi:hypothetical protein